MKTDIWEIVLVVAVVIFTWVAIIQSAQAYPFTVTRVLDGDTVEGDAQIWPGLTQHTRVRVSGVDTPEIHTKDACEKRAGYRAKAFTEKWLHNGDVSLSSVQLGKYAGRVVGKLTKDGKDLSTELLLGGYAYPYFGKKKQEFKCQE